MRDLVENPEDQFSQNEAHFMIGRDGSQVHGPNAVISMLDHALTFYGYGEKGAVMHCDNCGGEMKFIFSTLVLDYI